MSISLPTVKSPPSKRWQDQKFLTLGAPKIGKCFAEGQQICQANGTHVRVEHVHPGMTLLGPDGLPRRVIETHTGEGLLYELQFKHYAPVVVTGNHLLVVQSNTARSGWSKRKVMPVEEFRNCGPSFQQHYGLLQSRVTPYRPLEMLPIDPYVLGIWLGDGDSASGDITVTDSEILMELRHYADELGSHLRLTSEKPNPLVLTARITEGCSRKKTAWCFQTELRKLNVLGNKHIPQCYLNAPLYERLRLLAGVIDSDGYVSGITNYEVTLCRYELALDVVTLARSVGLMAYWKPKIATIKSIGYSTIAYRISLIGECALIPVQVVRKQVPPTIKPTRLLRFTSKPVGKGRFYGFGLTGDKLFLDGQLIVHHNSAWWAEGDKTLFLEFEPGLNHLACMKVSIRSWEEFTEVLGELYKAHQAGKFPYDTLVIDTLDRMIDLANEYVVDRAKEKYKSDIAEKIEAIGDIPNGAGWYNATNLVRITLDKLKVFPAAISIIGHTKQEKLKEGTREYNHATINIGGQMGTGLLGWPDHTLHWRTRMRGDIIERCLRTKPSEELEAGSRGNVVPDGFRIDGDLKTAYGKFRALFD